MRRGEVVAIAGVDGNGQSELIDALTGLRKIESGEIRISGREIAHENGARALRGRLRAHPGGPPAPRARARLLDRREHGTARLSQAAELSVSAGFTRSGSSSGAKLLIKEFDVRGGNPQTHARNLSGGNQQKVILAREIDRNPTVLIAAQPTRGLDVGAIEFVHKRLIEERDEGRAILLVSLELDEVLSLADRILVLYEGELVGEFPPTATEEELGLAMTGGGQREHAA